MRLIHGGPLFGIACLLTASLGLLFPVLGQHGDALIWPAVLSANAMSRACGGDTSEFLRTRPFDGAQRFVGGLLPPLALALLAPIAALCFVNLEWFNHAGLIGLFKHQTLTADDLRYLREVLGATFMPEKWPAEGLSTDLWGRLRPFLYVDVLRTALLIAALFFAFPIAKAGEKARPRSLSPGNVAILLVAFGTMLRVGLFRLYPGLPMPRLWFLALLATVSITHWVWRVRVVSAPAATGSSTPG
jgi:hypothetical protein